VTKEKIFQKEEKGSRIKEEVRKKNNQRDMKKK